MSACNLQVNASSESANQNARSAKAMLQGVTPSLKWKENAAWK